jgi:ribonuclease BN (tRNA processing enzyme)
MPKKSNNLQILFLGTASGLPVADRKSSALWLTAGNKHYLLDCGEGVSNSVLKHKLPYLELEAVFITHTHPDHCAGLPLLLQLMHVNKRTKPLNIYLPEEAIDPIIRYLWSCYLFPEFVSFQYHLLKLNEHTNYSSDKVFIDAHANSHLKYYQPVISDNIYLNLMQCYSLTIQDGVKKVVYSSDLGSIADLENIANQSDLLIVEGLHVKPEELFAKLGEWKVKQTILTHFAPGLEKKEKALLAMAKKYGVKNFKLAKDGMRVK